MHYHDIDLLLGYIIYDANEPTFDDPIGNVLIKRNIKKANRSVRYSDSSQEEEIRYGIEAI